MKFTVTIDQFEGPLDLMLHLIKENKLDLFDLDMNVLTTQYIEFIHQMKDLHLEIASEYLSELASLIEYKSKKLLPREEVQVEEDYEEDQRTKLVARLVECQKYKEISEKLRIDYENRQKHFTRPVSPLVEQWSIPIESDTLENQSPYELLKGSALPLSKPYETKVTIKELSVEERLEQIKERLKDSNNTISFETLCDDCSSLHMVIVTFLSILDLIHQKWLDFTIDSEDHIYVKRGIE